MSESDLDPGMRESDLDPRSVRVIVHTRDCERSRYADLRCTCGGEDRPIAPTVEERVVEDRL